MDAAPPGCSQSCSCESPCTGSTTSSRAAVNACPTGCSASGIPAIGPRSHASGCGTHLVILVVGAAGPGSSDQRSSLLPRSRRARRPRPRVCPSIHLEQLRRVDVRVPLRRRELRRARAAPGSPADRRPARSRCVANECRKACGLMPNRVLHADMYRATSRWTLRPVSRPAARVDESGILADRRTCDGLDPRPRAQRDRGSILVPRLEAPFARSC